MIDRILSQADDLNLDRRLVAILGLVAAFLIAFFINKAAGLFSGIRMDVTENNVHTLSPGTKKILKKLEDPVTIRFYTSDTRKIMSPRELELSKRIETKLNEFIKAAPRKKVKIADPQTGKFKEVKKEMLTIEKFNPEPDSDARDSAILDGIQPVRSEENNEMYLGIVVKCVDEIETLPFINELDEPSLEYKLISAISKVSGGSGQTVRIMTGLPIEGGMGANFQAPPNPKWAFLGLTEQKFKTEVIPSSTTDIPEDTACLMVLHPYDVTEEAQFAIDQYLLSGGNVIVVVDPNFYYARQFGGGQPMMPGMPPQQGPPPTSNLTKLFEAWGVKFDDQVLVDVKYGSRIRGGFSPSVFTMNSSAMDGKEDVITDRLDHIQMLTPGGFDITAKEGLTVDTLVRSSEKSQFVSSFEADPSQQSALQNLMQNFEASNTRFPLIARLRGEFTTAFPDGMKTEEEPKEEEKKEPNAAESEEAEATEAKEEEEKPAEAEGDEKEAGEEEKEEPKEPESLKKSVKPSSVVLIADVDFMFDPMCLDVDQTLAQLGIQRTVAINENLTLLENAIAMQAGDPDLIDVRSKIETRRPLTRQNDWRNSAEEKIKSEVEGYMEEQQKTQNNLSKLMSTMPENVNEDVFKSEIQKEIANLQKQEAETSKKIRQLRNEAAKDLRAKQTWLKFLNMTGIPFLVVIAGISLAVYRKTRTAAR